MSILASFLGGQQAGQQQMAHRQEQSKLAQLKSLAPQVISGDAGAYAQAAALDPKAAQGYQAAGDAQLKRLGGFIDYVEGARKTGNPQAVNAALAQGADFIQQLTGKPAPTEWAADMEPGWEALKAQVAMARGGQSDGGPHANLPSDIRSLKLLQEDPELAKLDRERRQAGGMVPKLVETSGGYGWGTPGGGIQLAPLEGVAGQGAPAQPQTQAPQLFAALGQKYGIQPTSVKRTPERNLEVGGVANSYHLTGQAADWAVPQQFKTQFMADARANGFEAIDEGDHIHIEPASRSGATGGIAQPYAAPAKEDAAPAGYRKTADGNMEIIPGGPADKPEAAPKPMPASILRLQRASREALSVSQGLGSSIAKVRQQLKDGDIKLGPLQNLAYQGMNAAGQSTKESRNYQGMRSTFEKMRNDSLRLNSGVQTEGDAQRAWAELLGNLNDGANVDQQLGRIQEINDRAIQLHTENMDEIETEYGGRNAPGRSATPALDASDFSNLWN